MDSIDLLALVRKFGKLDGIELFGYISKRLSRPANLFDSVVVNPNCFFVKMDVLAVNLQRYSQYLKELGITNKENNDIYLINGSVALCVQSSGVYPDWYATRGTLRFGSKKDSAYLTLFKFEKSGDNWGLGENHLYTMDINTWGRESRLYKSVYRSIENGYVTVPDDVKQLAMFSATPLQGIVTPVNTNNQGSCSLNDNLQNALNGVKPVEVLNSSPVFKVENRSKILERPKELDKLQGSLDSLTVSRREFINSLKSTYSIKDTINPCIKYMVNSLRTNLKSKPDSVASTGRVLLKRYLDSFGDYFNESYLDTTAGKYVIDNFNEIYEFIYDSSVNINATGSALRLCKTAFASKDLFYVKMLGIILGVSVDKFESLYYKCSDAELDIVKIVTENPYLILFIDTGFSYQDVDYIAYCLGKLNSKDIEKHKLAGIIFDYLNNSTSGSTVYKVSGIYNSKIGVSLTNAKYNQCMQTGTYLSDTLISNIHYYIHNSSTKQDYSYPRVGWVSVAGNHVLPLAKSELEEGVSLSKEYGLVVEFEAHNEKWLTSSTLLSKELEICNKFYELSTCTKGYNHKKIDEYIDEYEQSAGFRLEKEQRDAVHLIDNYVAIVTGSAGSGKTTVSDCMVYVLNKLEDNTIEYAAPTGKAAKRLQEVVKSPVQTFNAKFKIFGGSSSLFDSDDFLPTNNSVTYFFDEVSMANINLMYAVCNCLDSCSVYLLGDVCQLSPIGKGLPFKNLLRFLPCVRLNVSKRSADGSGITYNSKVINECSESHNWQNLKETSDFKIIPCSDDNIKRVTVLICKLHLGKITESEMVELCNLTKRTPKDFLSIPELDEDDIQVVTPLAKASYSWGTTQLNPALQGVFNPVKSYTKMFKYQVSNNFAGTKFAIGDRIVHSDSNMYSMQWYSEYEGGYFRKTYGFGISNGEVGKIVAFYPASACEFEKECGEMPKDFSYPVTLRNDASYKSEGNWFIVVEYFDFMSDSNFYILYRATENLNVANNDCRAFVGDDLKKLNLFYAGTTHKMQGSQSRLVIGLLGRVNFKGFITRNMLYTEVTRAKDGVYLIGSVSNDKNSQLSIARHNVADEGIDTIQELIFT